MYLQERKKKFYCYISTGFVFSLSKLVTLIRLDFSADKE